MSLKEFIAWLLSQGGAGMLAFLLIEQLPLQAWRPDYKRYFAFALTALIGCGAYYLATVMGYMPTPVDWLGRAAFPGGIGGYPREPGSTCGGGVAQAVRKARNLEKPVCARYIL